MSVFIVVDPEESGEYSVVAAFSDYTDAVRYAEREGSGELRVLETALDPRE